MMTLSIMVLLCYVSFMLNVTDTECRKRALYAEYHYAECR
jgi:hypothetical protein